MDAFKIPSHLPQDLLLIQDLVEESEVPKSPALDVRRSLLNSLADDCIDSSDSESEHVSEEEIEADLVKIDDEPSTVRPRSPSPSDSGTDTSSESHIDPKNGKASVDAKPPEEDIGDDEDDESGRVVGGHNFFQTKNEVTTTDFPFPDIEEVGSEEVLEKVGEIMNIIDNMAIVKGSRSEVANQGSEKALDSDTLLVFEDRKVLGYIHETFGPTTQPLYQVKFNLNYPLDPEKVRVPREVFHVPQRSRFVFLSQLKNFKGSDASNVHDEEPAEDELEFSDDEEEAAHKKRRRKRGESYAGSATSSRSGTPIQSRTRDQDLFDYPPLSANPYDEHGPYDIDFTAPSRPPPIPYDDPYSDAYYAEASNLEPAQTSLSRSREHLVKSKKKINTRSPSRKGEHRMGRDHGSGETRVDSWSGRSSDVRSRGRGRGRRDRSRRRAGSEMAQHDYSEADGSWANEPREMQPMAEPFDPRLPRPSFATALDPDAPLFSPSTDVGGYWSFQPPQCPTQPFGVDSQWYQQHPYIQPHINPRFASAFGLNFTGLVPAEEYTPVEPNMNYNRETYGSVAPRPTDEWIVHSAEAEVVNQEDEEQ